MSEPPRTRPEKSANPPPARRPLKTKASRRPASAAGETTLPTAAAQLLTRQAHSQERAQDYVEAVASLIESRGEARATDLAHSLGVSHVTVVRTVQRLQREGLLTSQPYRSIFLTEAGREMAAKAKELHDTVVDFLIALGVSPDTARIDAEGIEHHVSPETLAAFRQLIAERRPAE